MLSFMNDAYLHEMRTYKLWRTDAYGQQAKKRSIREATKQGRKQAVGRREAIGIKPMRGQKPLLRYVFAVQIVR